MDLEIGVHPGVSVVIFMLKLAYWMGITTVYLMGIDFDFTVPPLSQTKEKIFDNTILISKGEQNHFHPEYRRAGEKWTFPLLDKQRNEFALMKWRFMSSGRRIFNASRRTELDIFERTNFDNFNFKILDKNSLSQRNSFGKSSLPDEYGNYKAKGNKLKLLPTWERLHNYHKGSRAFIIGNGPSLRINDLKRLSGEITFASNKIFLAYDSTSWRPTYYTICDQMVAVNNSEVTRTLGEMMLLPSTLQKFYCSGSRTLWYDEKFDNSFVSKLSKKDRKLAIMNFSRNVTEGIHGGYTVIYHQLQLAFHMGIREIYLIGVDFSFNVPKTRKVDNRFESQIYRNAIVSEGEVNHFHPDYRKKGETWTMPEMDLQACGFRTARRVFEQAGGFLLNASRRTALASLQCIIFDNVVPKDGTC